jgi:MFS family permease
VSAGFAAWLALDATALAFVGFGFTGAFGISAISTLPAEALRERVRSAGLGYYFVWFFLGTAALPALGGWVGDSTGTAAAPMLVALGGQLFCLLPLVAFRLVQRRWPAEAPATG